MELASTLSLEMFGEPFLLEKRIRLLHAIREHGSISKAAKAVPMSYKSAWEAVDAMNALSPEPIVYRETGGRDGGGTTVTAYGERLLETYALLKAEHDRFLARLSELTQIEKGTVGTIGRLGMQLSARNQIQATVEKIVPEAVNAKVYLRLKSDRSLLSIITKEAVEDLHIAVNETIVAICKSSHVIVLKERHDVYENLLDGEVIQMEEDVHNVKMVVDIGGYERIVSVMAKTMVSQWQPSVGEQVVLGIEAKHIMLGR